MSKLVIIGTGLAGYTLAREFRRRDEQTELLLITRDDGSSYSKPMLSNALSKGKQVGELIMASAEKMAGNLNAEIMTHTLVSEINLSDKFLQTDRGVVHYNRLILANGARAIRPQIGGDACDQVLSVNDLTDYRDFRSRIHNGSHVVIVGAGMIGCEFANDLSNMDVTTHVIDLAPQVLGRILPEQIASVLQDKLTQLGVNWYLKNSVNSVEHQGAKLLVTLMDGTTISADVVLSAIGLRPDIEIAKIAGLDTDRGIKVNRNLQTSDVNVYALGDCAQVEDLTLPFVMPLMTSARALAATLSGDETAVKYPAMPVTLKTPCYPTVVCPPPRDYNGEWDVEITAQGIRAWNKDGSGNPLGFVLTDELIAEKSSLSKQLADWLVTQ